jgi:hypothetical protein
MKKTLVLTAAVAVLWQFPPLMAQDTKPAETPAAAVVAANVAASAKAADEKEGWKLLLEEKSLDGWEVTNYGGEGKVDVSDHQLTLEMGDPLTGITYKRVFPTSNYEIEVEAKRLDGSDFLCGLTIPVGEKHCSFIAGGWGGGVLGISSVDSFDASENATTQFMDFKNKQWYRFKVRVDDKTIFAFIDDKKVIEQEREGHEFSVRGEVLANRPLGYCVFQSKVQVRNFRWRPIPATAAANAEK